MKVFVTFDLDASPVQLGFAPTDRRVLDTAKYWTMVSKAAFSGDGEVRSFELYSGAANRGLRFGIYRPTGTTCQFKLVQQKEWGSFNVGYNKVTYSFHHQHYVSFLYIIMLWLL